MLCGAPGGIRTPDLRFRRPTLYPLSYGRFPSSIPGRARTIAGRRRKRRDIVALFKRGSRCRAEHIGAGERNR